MGTKHEHEQAMGAQMKLTETVMDVSGNEAHGKIFGVPHTPVHKEITSNGREGFAAEFRILRRMRDVKRLAGFYTSRAYYDAEHCYYTGLLFMRIAEMYALPVTLAQANWVLCHDALESLTGDLLSPAKNTSKKTKEAWGIIENEVVASNAEVAEYTDERGREILGPQLWELFKVCDAAELVLCCLEEEDRRVTVKNADGSSVKGKMLKIIEASPYKDIINELITIVWGYSGEA